MKTPGGQPRKRACFPLCRAPGVFVFFGYIAAPDVYKRQPHAAAGGAAGGHARGAGRGQRIVDVYKRQDVCIVSKEGELFLTAPFTSAAAGDKLEGAGSAEFAAKMCIRDSYQTARVTLPERRQRVQVWI